MAGFQDESVGQTINLGSGREIAIKELAQEVTTVLERSDAAVMYDVPRPGDVLRLCADPTKAHRLLGFESAVSLRAGLVRLRDWYLSLKQPPEVLLAQEIVRNWEPGEGRHG